MEWLQNTFVSIELTEEERLVQEEIKHMRINCNIINNTTKKVKIGKVVGKKNGYIVLQSKTYVS